MQELAWFLPAWPPVFGNLVPFGALLLAGMLGGELAHRLVALPRVTGYVLVGVICGPHALDLVHAPMFAGARVFVDLALGLIVFELGHRFDLEWLARNRWLAVAAVGESVGAFFAIYAGLMYFEFSPLLAACAAAVGTATSPAVVTVIAHELRASGQITERMLLFTAVNCVFAYVVLMLFMPLVHLQHATSWRSAILHPMYLLAGAALLGFAGSQALLAIAKWLGKREDRQFILLVALVVLVVGFARALNLPVVVALLTLGMLSRNLDYDHVLLPLRFGYLGQLVDPFARSKKAIGEDILDTAAAVMRQAERLGCADAVRELAEDVQRGYSDAGWLRARLTATGSLADVVRESAALWSGSGKTPHL